MISELPKAKGPSAPSPERQTRHPLRALGLLALFAVSAGALLHGAFSCPSARFFHVACPACGSTRSIVALLHGDLRSTLFYAPFAPLTVACLSALLFRAVFLAYTGRPLSDVGEGRWPGLLLNVLVGIVVAQIVLWALRSFGLFGGPVPV